MRAPLRAGCGALAIEVRRRAPADPGVVVVPLSAAATARAGWADELNDGDHIAVLGTLDIDDEVPAVLVQSIEPLVGQQTGLGRTVNACEQPEDR
jgi:hypothetical protein